MPEDRKATVTEPIDEGRTKGNMIFQENFRVDYAEICFTVQFDKEKTDRLRNGNAAIICKMEE